MLIAASLASCENTEDKKNNSSATIISLSFTECNTSVKSTEENNPSLVLTKVNEYLQVKALNTEFCCGADSISVFDSLNNSVIVVEIIDNGPHTHCFCPRDVEFLIGPLKNETYSLLFIESEHSYERDTFGYTFDFSQNIDTTLIKPLCGGTISNNPLTLDDVFPGGCNSGQINSLKDIREPDEDTVVFTEIGETLNLFVGFTSTCCITYGTNWLIDGDTLKINIDKLNDDFCDCICYYTFDFEFGQYVKQSFYYMIVVEDLKTFKGVYNFH
jgi:hypothetical protein